MMMRFETFSKFHLELIIYALLVFFVFYVIHSYIPDNKLQVYTIILGVFVLILKIFDSLNLHYTELKPWTILLPLHICNISLIAGAIFLITKKEVFFNILYFLSFGAIIAMAVPDWNTYNTFYYPYLYFTTHIMEYIILYLGFSRMKIRIDRKKYYVVLVIILFIMIISSYVNTLSSELNFMFLKTYAIESLSFIKSIWLYRILVVFVYFLQTYVMYLLFIYIKKKRKED
ncbi:TMEM164-related integral membrane acyltransferase [Oceanivirga miroungae]|uniref:Integral membrane protein n=1 Tax=Oceanivirga miroungae TaxID=1130046 RepID=A0A6I8M5X1_9FUSO|nr:TIGR02206 family membrane protein [Oceanivirga miroungae]VWL85339.1 hypothetical protein OMES3154_00624 [Oceanivirga miroungae]